MDIIEYYLIKLFSKDSFIVYNKMTKDKVANMLIEKYVHAMGMSKDQELDFTDKDIQNLVYQKKKKKENNALFMNAMKTRNPVKSLQNDFDRQIFLKNRFNDEGSFDFIYLSLYQIEEILKRKNTGQDFATKYIKEMFVKSVDKEKIQPIIELIKKYNLNIGEEKIPELFLKILSSYFQSVTPYQDLILEKINGLIQLDTDQQKENAKKLLDIINDKNVIKNSEAYLPREGKLLVNFNVLCSKDITSKIDQKNNETIMVIKSFIEKKLLKNSMEETSPALRKNKTNRL